MSSLMALFKALIQCGRCSNRSRTWKELINEKQTPSRPNLGLDAMERGLASTWPQIQFPAPSSVVETCQLRSIVRGRQSTWMGSIAKRVYMWDGRLECGNESNVDRVLPMIRYERDISVSHLTTSLSDTFLTLILRAMKWSRGNRSCDTAHTLT